MNEQATWDLTHLFLSADHWKKELEYAKTLTDQLAQMQDTLLKDAQNLYVALQLNDTLGEKLTALAVYAKMYFDQNMSNPEAKDIYETIDLAFTEINEKLSFFEPELLNLSETVWQDFMLIEPNLKLYDFSIRNLLEKKEHIFTQQIEEILTKMGALGNSFEKIYDDLTVNDIIYPEITTPEGEVIVADHNNYAIALAHPDHTFRQLYFEKLLGVYKAYINSISSVYYGSVKNDCFQAKSRHYQSAREMNLSGLHIPEDVYDNLITTVRNHTAPLQDYVTFRKEKLGLNEIHFSDLFVPLVQDSDRKYTYEEAQEIVLKALSVLGEDYVAILKEAFANRWVDVYPATNKATGA